MDAWGQGPPHTLQPAFLSDCRGDSMMTPGGAAMPPEPAMPMPGPSFPSTNPEGYMSAVQQLIAMIKGQQAADHEQLGVAQRAAVEPALQALMAAVSGQAVMPGVAEPGMPVEDDPVEGDVEGE